MGRVRALALSCALTAALAASWPTQGFAKSAVARAEAKRTNTTLAVAFDGNGQLRAKVCPARTGKTCEPADGVVVAVPAQAIRSVTSAKLGTVRVDAGVAVIWVSIPGSADAPRWEALIAPPLSGTAPSVLFSDWVGLSRGEYGAREGKTLVISDADARGVRRIVRGELREDFSLCGRETVLEPEVLDARTLEFRSAKMQRLGSEERARAIALRAERVEAPARPTPTVLRATAASSAVGDPAALTDGDPETTWSENRGGDGRGEFVVLRAPANLPLSGFEFVVRPPTRAVAGGAAPSEFWLLTSTALYRVSMPEDAWRSPGARYRVVFGRSEPSDCVALVTEKGVDQGPQTRVTFAEVDALSDVSHLDPSELVARLGRDGDEGRSAAAALQVLGEAGYAAVVSAFSSLDQNGRRVALDVLDSAPCGTGVEVYIDAALGPYPGLERRAAERLVRCSEASAPVLRERLRSSSPELTSALAELLVPVSPEGAVAGILPLFSGAGRELRAELRSSIARAARSPRGASAARRALVDPALGSPAGLELLRSLGDSVSAFLPEAEARLERVRASQPGFRYRYLLLEPAAKLAPKSQPARAIVSRSLVHDTDPRLRAKAAETVPPRLFANELVRLTYDREMRVRLAAVTNLGEARVALGGDAIAARLLTDPWPIVRAAAAGALRRLGPNQAWDAALVKSLEDESPAVRRPVLLAIGARGLKFFASEVRARLEDVDEWPRVRAAAAEALGALCDTESIDLLTEYAAALRDPFLDDASRDVAQAALVGLVELGPKDLVARLAPLRAKHVPPMVRDLAKHALERRGSCRRAAR